MHLDDTFSKTGSIRKQKAQLIPKCLKESITTRFRFENRNDEREQTKNGNGMGSYQECEKNREKKDIKKEK